MVLHQKVSVLETGSNLSASRELHFNSARWNGQLRKLWQKASYPTPFLASNYASQKYISVQHVPLSKIISANQTCKQCFPVLMPFEWIEEVLDRKKKKAQKIIKNLIKKSGWENGSPSRWMMRSMLSKKSFSVSLYATLK